MDTPDFFSPREQIRRIFRQNWRLLRIDLAVALGYVVMSFYALPHWRVRPGYYVAMVPFVVMGAVAAYLTIRTLGGHDVDRTAPFFFNRPLDRELAWRANAAFFIGLACVFDVLIVIGIWLGMGFSSSRATLGCLPMLFLIPPLGAILGLWVSYGMDRKWVFFVAQCVALGGLFIGCFWNVAFLVPEWPKQTPADWALQWAVAGALALVAAGMLEWGHRIWRARQIGEAR
jgi:hypothetical protein